MKLLLNSIWIFFWGTGALSAQPLDSLLSLVHTNNPTLRAGNFYYEALRQRENQALQWPEPEFSLGFIAFPFPNRSFMPSATFGAMQPIPWKSLREEKAGIALAEAQVALEGVEMERLELLFSVKEAYWQLYNLEQSTLILSENLKLLGSLEKLSQTNLELGKGTLEDVLVVKMRILDINQQLQQAQNARRSPQAVINRVLNRTATTPVVIEAIPLEPAPLPINDTGWSEVIARFPGNVALEYEIQASRSKQALNRTEGRPSISAGLDYVLMNTGEGIHATDGRDMLMPRIGVRLPLFRQTYLSRDEEERLRQAALADQQKSTTNILLASVEQAKAEWEDAQIQYRLTREQIPLIESALRLAETDLAAGSGSLEKSLRLYEQLLSVRLKMVQAVSKSFIAVAAIQKWIK
jgi:cobalt-zinc-cadmium efflux system outer membrane protein